MLERVLNITGSVGLLLLASPFFLVIPVVIKLADGGPVFYRGTRLGQHKRPFQIYKFRTLRENAQQIIGATLVDERQKLETPIGGLLRDTRLDELPQLFNVIKGDMNLIGPRPERPEIYEHLCKQIPGYDARFEVRPGAIGYAQLYTPHNSPKRLRSLIDRNYLSRNRGPLHDFGLFVYAVWLLALKALRTGWRVLGDLVRCIRCRRPEAERRELRRIPLHDATVHLRADDAAPGSPEISCSLVDLNKEAILIRCAGASPPARANLRLERLARHRRMGPAKRRVVHCKGELTIVRQRAGEGEYVFQVEPVSPLNEFKFHKYFVMSSIL